MLGQAGLELSAGSVPLLPLLFAVVVTVFLPSRAPAYQLIHDAQIQREIAWILQTDPYLGDDFFRVRVRNGIVYLEGHVTTLWERRRAEQLAGQVEGVVAIENNLTFSIFRNREASELWLGPP
ncbi:MAG TPA: BON domain-containing protein [Candidatus Eisenbacteria bacterium]|nr:BON domain-containing protein [Candidatus Eisenbacteria bacterium]